MDIATTPGAEAPPEESVKHIGCAHYKRKSKFVTPCCDKVYTCRFCHDEAEDHTLNRKKVTEIICALCDTRQGVQTKCKTCETLFGKYCCLECNLFDDEDKNQFHCQGCGICRIGGADRFFHCEKCNMCLPVQLKKNGHKCVENVSRGNCPVCLEDIHTSRLPCHIPQCGHLLHRTCFEQLLRFDHFACPVCQTSLMNMTQLWKYWDAEVENTPMPPEYRNYFVQILCKDCHKEGTVRFHVVGLKCRHCGSYNTCRIKGPVIIRVLLGYIKTGLRFFRYICNFVTFITRQIIINLPIFPSLINNGFERNLEDMTLNPDGGEASNVNEGNNDLPRDT